MKRKKEVKEDKKKSREVWGVKHSLLAEAMLCLFELSTILNTAPSTVIFDVSVIDGDLRK